MIAAEVPDMNDTRILFFGTPDFACTVLKELADCGYNIIAALSQPDRPQKRKQILIPTPVHALADELGIPVLQPEVLREAAGEIGSLAPDLIVTCAYGQFIPESILKIPPLGCLNIHPSLLPKYRGGAPIHHAIMNGDAETGVCLMEMVRKMDAGRVYDCIHVAIDEDDTQQSLTLKLKEASRRLIRESLPKYLNGELAGIEQDEDQVVIARNISSEEEKVSFREGDVSQVYNHIRAMIDWPVSYGILEGKRMRFHEARKEICNVSEQAGTILGFDKNAMRIAAEGGVIRILKLQPEGKKVMDAKDFANGAGRHVIGKVFE